MLKVKLLVFVIFPFVFVLLGGGCATKQPQQENVPSVNSSSGGKVSLYVRSLDQSSDNILRAAKELNIVEYKSAELTEKNQIKTLFLTVPNDKASELAELLSKEANDKVVLGAKAFYEISSEDRKPKNGTTNFEVALVSLSTLE